jgi:hypothetical protein
MHRTRVQVFAGAVFISSTMNCRTALVSVLVVPPRFILQRPLLAQEQFCTLLLGVIGRGDSMSDCSWMRKELEVVSAFKGFVPKKVNLIKVRLFQVSEAISLVPSNRKAVKGNLTSNAKGQVQIGKLLFHCLYHVLSNVILQIELFIIISFLPRAVATNGGNVEHATSELKEGSTLCTQKNKLVC